METRLRTDGSSAALVPLPVDGRLWEQVFTVAPLVLVGTVEGKAFDIAPKHLATPLSWEGLFGFVCSPDHATYRNIRVQREFTVSFPPAEGIVETSLAAGGRSGDGEKPSLAAIETVPARVVAPPLVDGCLLYLECKLARFVDGLDRNSLVVGRIVAASAPQEALRGAEIDDADLIHRLGLLAYLAPGRFASVRDSHAYPYPADFRR